MNRFGIVAFAGACAGIAAGSNAQGTISDGPVSLTNGFSTPYSSTLGNANLIGVAPVDPLFHHGWSYRQTSNLGANTLMGNFGIQGQSYVGDTSTLTYLNNGAGPAGVARFNAIFTHRIDQTPSGARVFTDLTVTNTNATPLTLEIFQVMDWDMAGTAGGDTAQLVSNVGGITLSQNEGVAIASLYSPNATGFSAGSTTLRTTYSSGGANLNGSTLFSGDAALALQWTLNLSPGQQVTIGSIAAYGEIVPTPGTLALLGVGGLCALRRRRA